MNQLEGCRIELLDYQDCQLFLDWVTGQEEPAAQDNAFLWLLAHCYDGVTWGRFDRSHRRWHLSSTAFPELCPVVSEDNLHEMRLFGPEEEILVWRTEKDLSGRRLTDEPVKDSNSPTRPEEEIRILLGARLLDQPRNGFTRVGTASGTEQAVPLECTEDEFKGGRWPLRLKVRHYFQEDQESGAVRVAVTRLVNVRKE